MHELVIVNTDRNNARFNYEMICYNLLSLEIGSETSFWNVQLSRCLWGMNFLLEGL